MMNPRQRMYLAFLRSKVEAYQHDLLDILQAEPTDEFTMEVMRIVTEALLPVLQAAPEPALLGLAVADACQEGTPFVFEPGWIVDRPPAPAPTESEAQEDPPDNPLNRRSQDGSGLGEDPPAEGAPAEDPPEEDPVRGDT